MTLFYHCYDHQVPRGGQREVYAHVDALCAAGLDACVFHGRAEARLQWFRNETPVIGLEELKERLDPREDYIILPQDLPPSVAAVFPGRKIIFNKGLYHGFSPVKEGRGESLYDLPGVVGAFVVSHHNAAQLRVGFPKLPIHVVRPAVDTALFKFRTPARKKRQIAFAPKNRHHIDAIFQLSRARSKVAATRSRSWRWVPIQNVAMEGAAKLLAESQLFLFLSVDEGLPRMPLEAMLSGCAVVCYNAGPLVEAAPHAFSAAYGDLAGVILKLERAARDLDERRPAILKRLERARKHALHFSVERAAAETVATWRTILRSNS